MEALRALPFDELRARLHGGGGAGAGGSTGGGGARAGGARGGRGAGLEVPDNVQELDVYLAGARLGLGGDSAVAGTLPVLSLERARAVCEGRTDFVDLEPLGEALAQGAVVVVAAERGDLSLKTAQCHLAKSLSGWLQEEQVDGDGRPFGVCKDTDPVSRRRFTKAQVEGIHRAAGS